MPFSRNLPPKALESPGGAYAKKKILIKSKGRVSSHLGLFRVHTKPALLSRAKRKIPPSSKIQNPSPPGCALTLQQGVSILQKARSQEDRPAEPLPRNNTLSCVAGLGCTNKNNINVRKGSGSYSAHRRRLCKRGPPCFKTWIKNFVES